MGFAVFQNQNTVTVSYTYEDQDREPIDLTGCSAVVLLAVAPDADTGDAGTGTPDEITADFDADRTTGLVTVDFDGFTTPGLWQLQMKATRADDSPLYGLPSQVYIGANLDD